MPKKTRESNSAFLSRTGRSRKASHKTAAPAPRPDESANRAESAGEGECIFALDIGTRSVIGIVAEQSESGEMKIIATERQEHKTRAMLDGQIHDVPQVAAVIQSVKDALAKSTGKKITSAAVAAAGRALYTMTAEAEIDIGGLISQEQERSLDFAGVQAAQAKLATSHTVDDPTRYYCVGYSTIKYELDGNRLKSLVGQRGKQARATVIATFLPRQVIDSMQSALHATNLEMRALTLEPIAAINVLIPPTMRHLNLVLVDIGAGTSDVAITKNSSVIAYGMVPQAGDEITEAISQNFLLDFNVAEAIKRKAADGQGAQFSDILGTGYDLSAEEIIKPVLPNIQNLANAIAKQILDLNGEAPQAVMLVGGGALTPQLQQFVADALSMPLARVAVRHPESVDGVEEIPAVLQSPDAVTPLGILKIASINTLHFLSVYVNDKEYSLFNFRELTVSDALLNAGINLRKFNGHPGLGLMVTVNGEKKSFPGTMGTLAQITLDGAPAKLDTPVQNDSRLAIIAGKNGTVPKVLLAEVVPPTPDYAIYINGKETPIRQQLLVNGEQQPPDYELKDGDVIESRDPKSLGEALKIAGYAPSGRRIRYTLNNQESHYACSPEILLNDLPATLSVPIHPGDHVDYAANDTPKLGEVLNLSEKESSLTIYYNKEECRIPSASVELAMNGRPASPNTLIEDGASIRYVRSERTATTVSDALLAVDFQPPAATSRMKFTLLVNGRPAEFTDPVKNGDTLDVILAPIDGGKGASAAAETASATSANPAASSPFGGSAAPAAPAEGDAPRPRRPSIADFIRRD